MTFVWPEVLERVADKYERLGGNGQGGDHTGKHKTRSGEHSALGSVREH